ncbi:zinc finger protein 830 [Cynara cardunculus var. scolymus]|uniref:zinc finger protein 830 n=1 Tax=Cynara cardunculus var. scolymus TaxID=59895 RepID=UPI000D628913|nr:zinc finger protein 830 [Cynara cardunculus var. scolymus]XP_024973574.1 zinc finger protein 830 [Cynara cardunculus var. scolymus]
MDAQAKKALYRAKLKAQKQDKRIDSPLVRYNESDQPVCRVCDIVLKSESAWSAHQVSAKHREAIKNVKANAAAASRVNNAKSGASTEFDKPKAEVPAESYKVQSGPPQAKSQSVLPSDFFDKPETKRQKNEITNAKPMDNDKKKKVLGSAEPQVTYAIDGENKRGEVYSAKVVETMGEEIQASQTRALPEGFFDDKDADLRARGITPVKLDITDEYKEFEKSIQGDLKEVENRMEEEEYDAAEMIEEAETVEQTACRERVEIFKRKRLELKAARSGDRNGVPQVVEKESNRDESSSDEDSDDAVDWRAKHL